MAKIVVGCAGWAYDDWIGPFYPRRLPKTEQLAHYAKFFNFVEVNSSFYNLPTTETLQRWVNAVPPDFRFAVKVWNRITHAKADSSLATHVKEFFAQLQPLIPKTAAFLFQFPPRFEYSPNHHARIRHMLEILPVQVPIVVELRDNAWFAPGALDGIVDGRQVILGTSYLPAVDPVFLKGQQHYYVRLVGDRRLVTFGTVQRHQREIMKEVTDVVKELSATPSVDDVFVIFNNHFTGFSPETANEFKRLLGLPTRSFAMQRSLLDFYKK